jgi:RNA polymerase sigma factor (sigma-70 family)
VSVIDLRVTSTPRPTGARSHPRSDAMDDAQLLAAAIERKDWAWPALVERYTGLVASITWSYRLGSADAAEVRQVVWMRLFESMNRIRQPECIAGWIRSVTRNECLRKLHKYSQEIPSDDEATFAGESDDQVDGSILARERQEAVRRALAELPVRGRVLLETLLEQPGLTYEELAIQLDMPIGSIGPTRQRCLTRLRAVPELALLAASA